MSALSKMKDETSIRGQRTALPDGWNSLKQPMQVRVSVSCTGVLIYVNGGASIKGSVAEHLRDMQKVLGPIASISC